MKFFYTEKSSIFAKKEIRMKRITVLVMVISMILLSISCSKTQNDNPTSSNNSDVYQESENQNTINGEDFEKDAKENLEDESALVRGENQDSVEQTQLITDTGNAEDHIADPDNKMYSKEKQKVLNDISKELDEIFIELDNMDDITDEDLEIN
jgi:hypothetical protein